MRHRFFRIYTILILIMILFNLKLSAQGMTRSNGIGVRAGFWNITNHPTRISATSYGKDGSVGIGGAGVWIYFFSKLRDNLFLELNLGAFGGAYQEHANYVVESVEATTIVPFLLGIRYDLLSPKTSSSLQPYLSFGGGPYWITKIQSENENGIMDETVLDTGQESGVYAGTGVNLLLASWLGLNFDVKYHFVDFKFENEYSGLELAFGLSLMWGKKSDMFQIKDIKLIVQDIYPAYYQFYSSYPIALISVKNVASYPIEVKVRSIVRPYSERPKDTEYVRIEKGKTRDIHVTATFGKKLMELSQREAAILDMEIEARAGRVISKTISERITLHSRNAWNGEIDKLSLFVTSDNEEILNISRGIITESGAPNPARLNSFEKAKIIFNELQSRGIHYHTDPNVVFYKDDRVQFALETLRLKNGDCDDLTVLYATLLESLGINTAFVEVRDPDKEIAHLYLLFDTNLSPDQGTTISTNDKKYLIREKTGDSQTVWIPVETTLIDQGFDLAWNTGAMTYLKEGVIRSGIEQGWMRIIDVE